MAVLPLELGDEITFGGDGSIKRYSPVGLDLSEPGLLSWSSAPVVHFEAMIAPSRNDFILQCTVIPFLGQGRLGQQQVFVYVNGIWVGFHTIYNESELALPVPRSTISSRITRFSFVIPTAVSPKHLGLSDDIRILGLGFLRFSLVAGGTV